MPVAGERGAERSASTRARIACASVTSPYSSRKAARPSGGKTLHRTRGRPWSARHTSPQSMTPARRPRSTRTCRKWKSPCTSTGGSGGGSSSASSSNAPTAGGAARPPSRSRSSRCDRAIWARLHVGAPVDIERERLRADRSGYLGRADPGGAGSRQRAREAVARFVVQAGRAGLGHPAAAARPRTATGSRRPATHEHGHRNGQRQQRREPRQHVELAPETRDAHLALREAEGPLVVRDPDRVVPPAASRRFSGRRSVTPSMSRLASGSSTRSSACHGRDCTSRRSDSNRRPSAARRLLYQLSYSGGRRNRSGGELVFTLITHSGRDGRCEGKDKGAFVAGGYGRGRGRRIAPSSAGLIVKRVPSHARLARAGAGGSCASPAGGRCRSSSCRSRAPRPSARTSPSR